MTTGQAITFVAVVLASIVAVASLVSGAVYVVAPFDFSIAGILVPRQRAFSWDSLFTGALITLAGFAAGYLVIKIQQALAKLFFMLELSRIHYCADEIERAFGTEASQRWLDERIERVKQSRMEAGLLGS